MGAASDLFDLATSLLQVCEDSLSTLSAGVPARSYVGHGIPALDCEQLSVSVYVGQQADTSPRTLPLDRYFKPTYGSLNLPTFVVSIVRCWPIVTLDNRQQPIFPAAGEISAAAAMVYCDGWTLWNGVQTAKRLGAFDGLCTELAMDPMMPIQPNGGFAGWTLPIEMQLDGFAVPLP